MNDIDESFDCSGLVRKNDQLTCRHGFPVFPSCNHNPMQHGQVPCMSDDIAARLFPGGEKPMKRKDDE